MNGVDRLDLPGIDATSASWPEAWRYELAPDAARFEHFEGPIAAQLGLGVAIDETLAIGVDRVARRIGELADHLRSELGALAGVELTDGDEPRGGIVTFASERCAPADLVAAATEARINIGTSRAATARLDLDREGSTRSSASRRTRTTPSMSSTCCWTSSRRSPEPHTSPSSLRRLTCPAAPSPSTSSDRHQRFTGAQESGAAPVLGSLPA